MAVVLQRLIGDSLARAHELARDEAAHRGAAAKHALRRARERHGIVLDRKGLAALEEGIRSGAYPVAGQANRERTVHVVRGPAGDMTVVWCPALGCIVTFLPPDRPGDAPVAPFPPGADTASGRAARWATTHVSAS